MGPRGLRCLYYTGCGTETYLKCAPYVTPRTVRRRSTRLKEREIWRFLSCRFNLIYVARMLMKSARYFHGWIVPLRGDLQWSARSPDSTPWDYYFFGLSEIPSLHQPFKDFRVQPKNNIRADIDNAPLDMSEKVEKNWKIRLSQCIVTGMEATLTVIFI